MRKCLRFEPDFVFRSENAYLEGETRQDATARGSSRSRSSLIAKSFTTSVTSGLSNRRLAIRVAKADIVPRTSRAREAPDCG